MFIPSDYLTLEDLFLNNEALTGYEVLQWLRFIHGRQHISPGEIVTVKDLYEGWKLGLFKVEGDVVSLREWEEN